MGFTEKSNGFPKFHSINIIKKTEPIFSDKVAWLSIYKIMISELSINSQWGIF